MPGKTKRSRQSMGRDQEASMRPQRNAGENFFLATLKPACLAGFNEAPAKCRGKLPLAH